MKIKHHLLALSSQISLCASAEIDPEIIMPVTTEAYHAATDTYALGVGKKASDRLDLQHRILGRDFQNHLLEAGLKKGMTVLDIGCGNGLMTLWVALQVGEHGRVIAVDMSEKQIDIAKQRRAAASCVNNIEFICCDFQDLDLPPQFT